jgi:hypothetical protein
MPAPSMFVVLGENRPGYFRKAVSKGESAGRCAGFAPNGDRITI